jgi:hypothetical protein
MKSPTLSSAYPKKLESYNDGMRIFLAASAAVISESIGIPSAL